MKRLRDAFRWNEPQVNAVVMMTLLTLAALVGSERPWWAWVLALMIWPLLPVVVNYFDGPKS